MARHRPDWSQLRLERRPPRPEGKPSALELWGAALLSGLVIVPLFALHAAYRARHWWHVHGGLDDAMHESEGLGWRAWLCGGVIWFVLVPAALVAWGWRPWLDPAAY